MILFNGDLYSLDENNQKSILQFEHKKKDEKKTTFAFYKTNLILKKCMPHRLLTKKCVTAILLFSAIAAKAQFFTQNAISDLNSFPNDLGIYTPTTANKAPSNYGTILGLRFSNESGSDWRTQLAFTTEKDFYFRQSINNAGNVWTEWLKIFHSGNLNNSDTDFHANHLIAKELAIYSNDDNSGWGTSHIYWKGHSLIMGSPKGAYAHNSLILRPGGATNGYLDNTFEIDVAHGIDNYETRIRFSASGNSFINSGNVGIGTKNPQNKLDVNGTIHSKEVKVDMFGWDWPDYVFKKEYHLPTLLEVEKHINEKGHLENIPSEKEVIKNGLNLGEMDAKLLQKIEELTLYVIDLNKKLEEQNEELELMKKELACKK
ncbi:pyocin knob domain-containing protein [Flavobacterium humidisoli]|uniref:Pyocin knob domain-containing protein n=1 Tax=Flavobacterium humidisoli TaxID=2937442 RepID=A0ABY4LS76_9FLAO|nr:pyocin knob domain-containing protein [Flavobacterium humidisoli]UPZ15697.1 pyocin knob domain-containing protein [Flavobacterium humidisoli]